MTEGELLLTFLGIAFAVCIVGLIICCVSACMLSSMISRDERRREREGRGNA